MDMNMKKILTCALIACSVAAVTSCEDSDDIWNVKLQTLQSFDIVGATTDTVEVDFANGDEIAFQGAWNTKTNWKLVIVGNESNETDTICGNSTSLNGVVWNGNVSSSSVKYFPSSVFSKYTFNFDLFGKSGNVENSFKAGETCTILLQFPDYYGADTCKTVVKIASAKEETFTAKDYCVFGDFETVSTKPLYQDATITYEKTNITAAEGSTYCLMQGTETGGKWYIAGGGFSYPNTSGWSEMNGVYPITKADTATTYINFMMYGFPGYCERTSVYLALMNGDDDSKKAGIADRVSVQEGWHGVSIPVSKFLPDAGASIDYDAVDKIIFALFSNGEAGQVKCAIDFLVITKKYPLFPVYNSSVE